MKLCIPVVAPNGLDSLIEPHLPSAEHLLFFDTESRSHAAISLREQQAGAAEDFAMHAVLCGSINRVTLRTLIEQGVKVYGTDAQTVTEAIRQYENGELEAAGVAAAGGGGCSSGQGHGGCCSGDTASHSQQGAGGCHGSGGGCGGGSGGKHDGHGEHHGAGGGCCGSEATPSTPAAQKPLSDTVKIAVCSQNRKTVTEHAGKCRKFWIYEVQQGEVKGRSLLELPLEQALHSSPPGAPHPLDTVDVLIGAGMGSGLQQRLAQRGIRGVVSTETQPDQAVAAFLAGGLL